MVGKVSLTDLINVVLRQYPWGFLAQLTFNPTIRMKIGFPGASWYETENSTLGLPYHNHQVNMSALALAPVTLACRFSGNSWYEQKTTKVWRRSEGEEALLHGGQGKEIAKCCTQQSLNNEVLIRTCARGHALTTTEDCQPWTHPPAKQTKVQNCHVLTC